MSETATETKMIDPQSLRDLVCAWRKKAYALGSFGSEAEKEILRSCANELDLVLIQADSQPTGYQPGQHLWCEGVGKVDLLRPAKDGVGYWVVVLKNGVVTVAHESYFSELTY
ncbi:MAG: hypothetical protein ABQ298_03615 [Puniceicoccaceae bacterium]